MTTLSPSVTRKQGDTWAAMLPCLFSYLQAHLQVLGFQGLRVQGVWPAGSPGVLCMAGLDSACLQVCVYRLQEGLCWCLRPPDQQHDVQAGALR